MQRPTWREPRRRPEQRPTVNITVIGIEHVVPRMFMGHDGDWYLEIGGVAFNAGLDTLDRLTAESNACVRSVM